MRSSRREATNLYFALYSLGFRPDEADALRAIARVLHRWDEAQCNGDVCRDEDTGVCYRQYGRDRGPFLTKKCVDREAAEMRRLAKILAQHSGILAYRQTDPRGPSLYLYNINQLCDGDKIDSVYNSIGVPVF